MIPSLASLSPIICIETIPGSTSTIVTEPKLCKKGDGKCHIASLATPSTVPSAPPMASPLEDDDDDDYMDVDDEDSDDGGDTDLPEQPLPTHDSNTRPTFIKVNLTVTLIILETVCAIGFCLCLYDI